MSLCFVRENVRLAVRLFAQANCLHSMIISCWCVHTTWDYHHLQGCLCGVSSTVVFLAKWLLWPCSFVPMYLACWLSDCMCMCPSHCLSLWHVTIYGPRALCGFGGFIVFGGCGLVALWSCPCVCVCVCTCTCTVCSCWLSSCGLAVLWSCTFVVFKLSDKCMMCACGQWLHVSVTLPCGMWLYGLLPCDWLFLEVVALWLCGLAPVPASGSCMSTWCVLLALTCCSCPCFALYRLLPFTMAAGPRISCFGLKPGELFGSYPWAQGWLAKRFCMPLGRWY